MTSRLWIYTGDRPSNGAKELAAQEGFLRLRQHRLFKVKPNDVVINWGTSTMLEMPMLNKWNSVKIASNKLDAFSMFELNSVNCVPWTTDKAVVLSWCLDGSTVVGRSKLTGHSGDGIFIIEKGSVATLNDIQDAPLYTKYVFKTKEFRVHVVNGKVIDTQQKIKDPDREVVTWKVRSHDNGFIFARNGIVDNAGRDELAVLAVSSLGLDFGAVDLIEDKKGQFYVLEVNSAPGLEGQTIDNYAKAFRNGG